MKKEEHLCLNCAVAKGYTVSTHFIDLSVKKCQVCEGTRIGARAKHFKKDQK